MQNEHGAGDTPQTSHADEQLRAKVEDRLRSNGQVDPTKIGVVVRQGQVLLWGSVANEHERTTAGEVAGRVVDRTAVINHIQVFRTTQF